MAKDKAGIAVRVSPINLTTDGDREWNLQPFLDSLKISNYCILSIFNSFQIVFDFNYNLNNSELLTPNIYIYIKKKKRCKHKHILYTFYKWKNLPALVWEKKSECRPCNYLKVQTNPWSPVRINGLDLCLSASMFVLH